AQPSLRDLSGHFFLLLDVRDAGVGRLATTWVRVIEIVPRGPPVAGIMTSAPARRRRTDPAGTKPPRTAAKMREAGRISVSVLPFSVRSRMTPSLITRVTFAGTSGP